MFRAALPDVPSLAVCASVSQFEGQWISATGVGVTPVDATLRHDAELAERRHLARHPVVKGDGPVGVAAGLDDVEAIRSRAARELIERWACNDWWAGRRGHCRPGAAVLAAFEDAQRRWPRRAERRTALLQVITGMAPPLCVAWSCDALERSVCFGAACREDAATAAESALTELYQMEFGLAVIRHRDARGVVLSPVETAILERARALTLSDVVARSGEGGTGSGGLADGPPGIETETYLTPDGIHHVAVARFLDPVEPPPGSGWPFYAGG